MSHRLPFRSKAWLMLAALAVGTGASARTTGAAQVTPTEQAMAHGQVAGQAGEASPSAAAGGAGAPAGASAGPVAGAPRGMRDPYANKRKLLIWADVQTGFHHDAINHAIAVIERLGRQSGAYVSIVRTDSQLVTKQPIVGRGARYTGRPINARNLSQFDAIFFLGAGEGTLNAQQKADLLSFVRDDGKGLVVGHAAGVAFFDWPEWGNLIGGFMDTEYPVQPMPIVVDDPKFPGVQGFGTRFTFADQFPVMKAPYAKGKVHTIMRLDWARLTPEQQARRPDGDIPIVFTVPYGKGRVFNSGFGHPDETWDDPRVQTMYLEAIRWAMGMTSSATSPDR